MLYDYQYNIAAIVFVIVLLVIYMFRRSFVTRSSRIFITMMYAVLVASALDLISCFSISYPDQFPRLLNNFVSLGYLFAYNLVSVIYFYYVDSITKVSRFKKINYIISRVLTVVLFVLISTSPLTHLVAYFEENESGHYVYQHGPLMSLLFAFSFVLFALELVMLIHARKRMTPFQYVASVSFVLVMSCCISLSIIFPRVLIGEFGCVITLFFVYAAFEDPAYFTFHETSCLNRRAFKETISHHLNTLGNDQFSIVAFAIDDYAYLQRSLGMALVGEATVQCAGRLYRKFKRNVFCLSDDKYAIYVPPHSGIAPVMREVDELFSKPFNVNGEEIYIPIVSCTLPYINSSFTTEDVEELVEYRLSNMDENFESTTSLRKIIEKKHLRDMVLHAIVRAIENEEFRVYYQPIYNVATGKFDSAEALIRLFDNELGFINPEFLITLSEEAGYIQQVGEIVFKQVCQFIRENDMEELGIKYIEVNLSSLQLDENHSMLLHKMMDQYQVSPSQINFEITETSQLGSIEKVKKSIEYLSAQGVDFSIDDFGSGFASSEYLLKFPVSIVKIDKSILWQAMESDDAMKVLAGTISMIHDLGKEIVVEGVENEEMKQTLESLGCDHLQGYYFSKPIPDFKYKEFLLNNKQKTE